MTDDLSVIDAFESNVRSYCRSFPVVLSRARGCELWTVDGRRYLDFLAGAGSLNYGHNHPTLARALADYVTRDGICHSLDLATEAKIALLDGLQRRILWPRGLEYKVQFPGPTGTNAVEAALKLARKVTGRRRIAAFTGAFHGMTAGALSLTGSPQLRAHAGAGALEVDRLPFEGDLGPDRCTVEIARALFASGALEAPAAFIVETVQGEGGVRVASIAWLRSLAALARDLGSLLIIDDIQAGCGRTGSFFSFEPSGITPDIVCVAKSISGYGLPMSLVLLRPALDIWEPGEHNGTFRGNNLAFVTARAAIDLWCDDDLGAHTVEAGEWLRRALGDLVAELGGAARVRGRGLMIGLELDEPGLAVALRGEAFQRGLIVETAGPTDRVLKLLPPLVVTEAELAEATSILESSLHHLIARRRMTPRSLSI